jgi:hypothetical protein
MGDSAADTAGRKVGSPYRRYGILALPVVALERPAMLAEFP